MFAVKLDDSISNEFNAPIGLPQGSSLAPALFKFFIFDLPQPRNGMRTYGFADDVLAVASGKPLRAQRHMQHYLQRLQEFYKKNELIVNVAKSQSITITGTLNRLTRRMRSQCKQVSLKMNGNEIPSTTTIKYLGITTNDKYSFVQNTTKAVEKICRTMGSMKHLLARQGLLSQESKLAFYKAAIRPALAYGFPVWSSISSHQMERIRAAERRFLRWTRSDWGRNGHKYVNSSRLYSEAGVERIDVWMFRLYTNSFDRFRNSNNEWMQELFSANSARRALRNDKYQGPETLFHMNEATPLINAEGKFLHFNRRIRDGHHIYVTAQ